MTDYAIFIPESSTFVQDPWASLEHVQYLMQDRDFATARLEGLALAQRLFFPDHPESLFVPALLHEAYGAWKDGINATAFS